jgi:hypothetical protein
MNRTIEDMVKEIYTISKGFSKGMVEIIIPPTGSKKPKWCKCPKCAKWHILGE